MRRLFLPIALVILLVAAGLRITQLRDLPPGPHFDEAANLLITRSIAFGGADQFPITDSYQGRETLYHYVTALMLQTIGDFAFTMQVTSAYAGLLTLAASMALGRAMFGGRRGIVVGVAIGVLMAVSFHQIFMARQAYRAVLLPLMQALALLLLWRGLRRNNYVLLAIGGVFAGGALYTYMASRLFPVWLSLGGLVLLWADRLHWRRRLAQGLVFFGVMAIVAVPLISYALDNPDIFFGRLNEVTNESDVVVSLETSIRRHLEMFFIRGEDGNLRYNVPGRPYFNPLEGALLVIGFGVALWRVARPGVSPVERAAYCLAILAPLMVIPSVISVGGFPPNHMRSLGMVPLIFVLVAVGFEAVIDAMSRRVSQSARVPVLVGTVIAALLVGAGMIANTYFNWATRTDLFYQADGDLAEAAAWLGEQVVESDHVYIASFHREHPTIITGWSADVTWMGFDSFFLPPPGERGLYVMSNSAPLDWLSLPERARLEGIPHDPDGQPAFRAFELIGESYSGENITARNPYLALIDAQAQPTESGDLMDVLMTWRVEQTPPYYRLRPIVTLKDMQGNTRTVNDVFLLGTDQWRVGETMIQRVSLDIPTGTPPGEYTVDVTWVDRDSDTFLSYVDEAGHHAGIAQAITTVEITRPASPPDPDDLTMTVREQVVIAEGVTLLGWTPPAEDVLPGAVLRPVLHWQMMSDEMVEAILRDSTGDETVIFAGAPLADVAWQAGDILTEIAGWTVPVDQPGGVYTLVVRGEVGEVTLGTVRIADLTRVFTPPQVETITQIGLGESLSLYGYNLTVAESIVFEPVWQAEQTVTEDYTVFVHVVDSAGIIVTQRDMMPVQNSYPTSLWLAGEYVADRYVFDDVPPGEYILRVGMYIQQSGRVLPIQDEESMNFIEVDIIGITDN